MSNTDGEDSQRIEKETEDFRLAFTEKIRTVKAQWIGVKDDNTALREQLKQQEEVIRELIPIAEERFEIAADVVKCWIDDDKPNAEQKLKRMKAIIEKAKSLTTKDKCSED